jgi:hypothetical protein
MASARVGSPICSIQLWTGTWVAIKERLVVSGWVYETLRVIFFAKAAIILLSGDDPPS